MTVYGHNTYNLDAMSSFEIPGKPIRLVRMTMINVICLVKVDGKLAGPFATTKGLRLGERVSCLLFNLALERAIRDSSRETTGTIFYKSPQILAYADDIDIIDLRLSYVAEAYQGFEQAAENLELQMNKAKTKPKKKVETSATLPITNPNLRGRDLQKGECTFEVVQELTYLGLKVSNANSKEAERCARMLVANQPFYSLRKQFTSKILSQRTKLGL